MQTRVNVTAPARTHCLELIGIRGNLAPKAQAVAALLLKDFDGE